MNISEGILRLAKNPLKYIKEPKRTLAIFLELVEEKLKLKNYTDDTKMQYEVLNKKLKEIYFVDEKIVIRRGPFQGMKYPEFLSTGSSLWPKLAGVYEREIQQIIYESLQEKYKYFIDVGCAEGYYAVGYALSKVAEMVYAFDIDNNAQMMCQNMCKLNNVEVEIGGWCTSETLKNWDFGIEKKSLIMADCEGYERELFTKDNVNNLKNVDLIIEVHDWLQYETPTLDYLIGLFDKTHEYRVIYGIDDYEKAYRYSIEELNGMTIQERFEIFRENRKRLGVWIYFKALRD